MASLAWQSQSELAVRRRGGLRALFACAGLASLLFSCVVFLCAALSTAQPSRSAHSHTHNRQPQFARRHGDAAVPQRISRTRSVDRIQIGTCTWNRNRYPFACSSSTLLFVCWPAGYLVLPSFLSAHVLVALQRECDRLSTVEHQVEDWHERGAEKISTLAASNRAPLVAPQCLIHAFSSCCFCAPAFVALLAGYVVESMPSGVLDEQDPARFCARAYATARGASIEQRCNSRDESDAASITTAQLTHTIAADNATVCDLLFRNASLLKIVDALLRQCATAGWTKPQAGDKRKSSSSGRSGSGDPSSSPRVWLFNEQYISKPPHTQLAQFGWVSHKRDACVGWISLVALNARLSTDSRQPSFAVRLSCCFHPISTRIAPSSCRSTRSVLAPLPTSRAGAHSTT